MADYMLSHLLRFFPMLKSGLTAIAAIACRAFLRIPLRKIAVPIAILAALWLAGYYSAIGQETNDSYKLSRDAQQGKLITPVPVNLTGQNPLLVYLGSYLVNAQEGCNDCHTCPSYKSINPYTVGGGGLGSGPTPINAANFMSGGTPFTSGTTNITSPNLTPDSSGHPGGMTFAQFQAAMQEGQDPHTAGRTLQVMPWPNYRYMYQQDIRAIYDYLSAIPPAPSGVGQCTVERQTK